MIAFLGVAMLVVEARGWFGAGGAGSPFGSVAGLALWGAAVAVKYRIRQITIIHRHRQGRTMRIDSQFLQSGSSQLFESLGDSFLAVLVHV